MRDLWVKTNYNPIVETYNAFQGSLNNLATNVIT